MPSLLGSLMTVRSALLSHQAGMAVTSHNLANATTEGYTRQRANLQTLEHSVDGGNTYGFGVDIASITRSRDEYIDRSLRGENSELQRNEVLQERLAQISDALGDPSDGGFVTSIQNFFASWQDLANDPESISVRSSVRSAGQSLTNEFQRLATKLTEQSNEAESTMRNGVSEVNRLAQSISELNTRIAREVSLGRSPNDLLDERDRTLDELSQWGNITIQTNSTGTVRVNFGDSSLVDGENVTRLRFDKSGTAAGKVVWDGTQREVIINSGQFAGAKELLQTTSEWKASLDSIAVKIAQEVNSIHQAGVGSDGSTGVNFFAANIGGASDFRLDASIVANVRRIASSGGQGESDGLTARAIGQLQQQTMFDGKTITATISDFYGTVGNATSVAETNRAKAEAGLSQLSAWQSSVSSVSVDEETMSMLKHQQAFAAASKAYTTLSSMMDTLLAI
ncbi:MAG: flagellar hook-associated protein FlgK [bacterium]|nr:flagellar hook-associated protein FlgK [bacterium]